MAHIFPHPTKKWHSNTYPTLSATRPELSAKGKSILITGGGTGIGAETARQFAQAGASRIALLGRREQPLLDTKAAIENKYPGVKVFAAPTDITKQSEVDAAFARFAGDGKINVVVSNAAITGPLEPVADVDAAAFLEAVQINLGGNLYVAKATSRYCAEDAVIIDVSSMAAHLDVGPMFSAYSVAKMAVIRLWASFGFGHPGMSVFHVQPGVVDTDMNKAVGGVSAMGTEDHVSLPGSFHLWLASPEAQFLKGKFLWANWDMDELMARAKEFEGTTMLNIDLGGWPFGADPSKSNPLWDTTKTQV